MIVMFVFAMLVCVIAFFIAFAKRGESTDETIHRFLKLPYTPLIGRILLLVVFASVGPWATLETYKDFRDFELGKVENIRHNVVLIEVYRLLGAGGSAGFIGGAFLIFAVVTFENILSEIKKLRRSKPSRNDSDDVKDENSP